MSSASALFVGVIAWTCSEEDPDAERMWVFVVLSENMSVGWAEGIVWRVRYCFDCRGIRAASWRGWAVR